VKQQVYNIGNKTMIDNKQKIIITLSICALMLSVMPVLAAKHQNPNDPKNQPNKPIQKSENNSHKNKQQTDNQHKKIKENPGVSNVNFTGVIKSQNNSQIVVDIVGSSTKMTVNLSTSTKNMIKSLKSREEKIKTLNNSQKNKIKNKNKFLIFSF